VTFVSIEGLDGSGKTTVQNAITENYPEVVTTSEPSDLQFGQQVRERLSQPESNEVTDFYVFMADRQDHIDQRIKPADQQGKLVVSDRYADSTRAYQPVAMTGEGKPFDSQQDAKEFIEATMSPWNYQPDITLYMDIGVDTAIERAAGDEKYEQRAFLEQVSENYEDLCSAYDRITRIDAEQNKQGMIDEALTELENHHKTI
jgi:thymidylate kinase